MRLSLAACWATQGNEGKGRLDVGVEVCEAGLRWGALEEDERSCPLITGLAAGRR